MTPDAPMAMTLSVNSRIGAKPGDEAPRTTGTRPATRAKTVLANRRDSSAVSLVASPRMVRPVAPQSR